MMKILVSILLLVLSFTASSQDTWNGLIIEAENRCAPYDKKSQYPYPQSIEDEIVAAMEGRIYGPYTGRYFESDTKTDIEHIVAASEGHDSGLCSASAELRKQFATDLLNLTLAAPKVNRCGSQGKCGLDPAEWMPKKNKCWFAGRVVKIKRKYGLSVDSDEARILDAVLANCDNVNMVFFPETEYPSGGVVVINSVNVLAMYDDNKNGRITCAEARHHGITPVRREHPAYEYMNDRDGDGIVCE